ncbi:MAG TPA: GNAT family N-acetyltransferase [Chitinophagaceae bacterium]|jgi:RimJ/RimL family protein N-acetyltransferase|nr:GNAT family N-acetyltransferase [Chitinophagaceae bacterium]
MVIFTTERLLVRHFTENDRDNYFALQGDPDVMQYIRAPRTREESDTFLTEKILSADPHDFKGYWAVEDKETGEFLGCFVIIPIPDDVEKIQLGYSFLPVHWSKGYATEVTKEGVNYFYTRTPLAEIYGVTETPNIASQKVLLKAGFSFHEKKIEGEKELTVFIVKRQVSSASYRDQTLHQD